MTSKCFVQYIDEVKARNEIEDALKRFIRGIDRQDWTLARSTYHDDAIDDHGFFRGGPEEFLAVVARAHARQEYSVHVITNILIEFVTAKKALVESYCLVFQRFGADTDAPATEAHGKRNLGTSRYLDVFEERDGEWRVAHRTLVFGDMQSAAMAEPVVFPSSYSVQQHNMRDPYYAVAETLGLRASE